jgi:ribosomal protein L37AE/L43A
VFLESLRQVSALPDTIGAHACECGHPEMRRPPDGVFDCPPCGSEILPSGWYGTRTAQKHGTSPGVE